MKNIKKGLAIFLTLALILTVATPVFATDSDSNGYNDHDFTALQTFLNLPSAEAGNTNGQALNPAYSEDDPATWTGVTWSTDEEKRVTKIDWGSIGESIGLAGSLNLSDFSALDQLDCGDNQITSLNVSGCTSLERLECYVNQLTSLQLTGCGSLTVIDCGENQITSLDITDCTALQRLYYYDNQISSFIVPASTALTQLDCSNNRLESLDVSGHTELEELYCSGNGLESLIVSGCTALERLDCNDNDLESLDASTCLLKDIEVLNNPLTSISARIDKSPAGSFLIELEADGDGSVGLQYNISDASERRAVATPDPGAAFINWTDNESDDVLSEFEEAGLLAYAYDLTAKFSTGIGYNEHDIVSMQAFLNLPSAVAGKTNGQVMQAGDPEDYDEDDPATWPYIDWTIMEGELCIGSIFWDEEAGFTDLAGSLDLSGCQALEYVYCYDNQLTSLNVSNCTALKGLDCSNNLLEEIVLSGCTQMSWLYCDGNMLEDLNVSGLTGLLTFECNGNLLTSLDVSDLENVKNFNCSGNQLSTLSVSGCTDLIQLNCGNNQITSLPGIADSEVLRYLYCGGNQMEELDVSGSALEALDALYNPFNQISAGIKDGSGGSFLIEMEAVGNGSVGLTYGIEDVRQAVAVCDPGSAFINWTDDNDEDTEVSTEAALNLNAGTNYDLTANFTTETDYNDNDFNKVKAFLNQVSAEAGKTNGQALSASYNEDDPATWTDMGWTDVDGELYVEWISWDEEEGITNLAGSLNLSGCESLVSVECYGNQLTSLDVSGCTALEDIDCSDNLLEDIDFSGCTKLSGLYCGGNQLEGELDVSGFTNLSTLECISNKLTSLNVSNLENLFRLGCNWNQLEELDVSGCIGLYELDCSGNQITSLSGMADSEVLQYFYCSGNQLEELDVSGSALEVLEARVNRFTQISAGMTGNILVELDADGPGTVGLTYDTNEDIMQAFAVPDPGSSFINWTDNDAGGAEVSTDPIYNLSADTSYNLTANFQNGQSSQYNVTFDKNSGDTDAAPSAITADQGTTITTPAVAPTRDGYTFGGWYKEAECVNAWNFDTDTVTANITLYAKWTPVGSKPDGPGKRSGGGSGSNTPATPPQSQNATVSGGGAVPVTVNTADGSASLDLGTLAGTLSGVGNTVVTVPPIASVNSYTANLPTSSLSGSGQGSLTLNTGLGSLTIPGNMLSGTGLSGDAGITIGEGDASGLPDDISGAIGDRPVIQLTLSVNGQQTAWENSDAPVTLSIPYTPTGTELEHPESIVVWYIDGSGNAVCVENGRYDPVTGTVTVDVKHFSDYAVAYNQVSFSDVPAGAWYYKPVSFIAAREITTGTGGGNFSPNAKLTRGQFIVMLMKAYEIAPDAVGAPDPMAGQNNNMPETASNFADAGSTYYTGYLAAAKRLGISGGVGDNMFAPGREITRQEMFTMLYNALKAIGQLPQTDNGESGAGIAGKALSGFSDAGDIASWAEEAMTLFTEAGTVGGNGGKLAPADTATRAEMAQMLYNLLSK